MAYLSEFPNWESNGRNLDWLLEQYSTFNERLQQIVDEFHESVQQMESDISNLELEYQRKLDTFEGRVLNEINTISNAIEQVSTHVVEYVSEHMTEWQIQSSRASIVVTESNNTYTFEDIDIREHDIVIDGVFYARVYNDRLNRRFILPHIDIPDFSNNDEYSLWIDENNHPYMIIDLNTQTSATVYIQYHII